MEKILTGSIVFFVFFTLVSYFLIVLNLPYLIPILLILLVIFKAKAIVRSVKKVKIKYDYKFFITIVVFTLGIVGQLAIISPSGITKNGDLLFWSSNGHDGMWHIALMEEIKRGHPFQNPIFAGEKLVNYHFFSDIAPAVVAKYLPLSNFDLYFRIFPFIYSLFLGVSAYYLTKKLTKSFSASIWAVIFTYFAGSFGFIVTYLKNKTIGGESIFWATQPQSSSGNPPQIISNFILLTALYFLVRTLEERKNNNLKLIFIILAGTLASFKVYAGFILLLAVGAAGVWQYVKERDTHLILLAGLSGLLSAILYFPNSSNSTNFLIFQPWWYIRTMIVEPSRLNLLDWELRRQTYIYESNWKRVIFLEGLGFIIFFFGNLGMRFVGLEELFRRTKTVFKNNINLIMVLVVIFSITLPLLFLQKGVASNTSQFLQYYVLLLGIFSGVTVARLIKKFKFVLPLIVILMVPTQIGLLYEFYSRPAFARISAQEIEALKFVKQNTPKEAVILTPPYNQYLDLKEVTPNIWDWFDTSYVSALSSRRTYMDDYEQLDIMGYDYKPRLENKIVIFEGKNKNKVREALALTGAKIIYFPKETSPKINLEELGFTRTFENDVVEVYQAN